MGYFLRGHPGSGDHGWEDRVRGTCAVLEGVEICSARPEEDWRYGLGKLAPLHRERTGVGLRLSAEGKGPILWDRTSPILKDPGRHGRICVPDRRSLAILKDAGLQKKARLGPDPLFLVERQLRAGMTLFRQPTVGFGGWPGLPYSLQQALIRAILQQHRGTVAMIPYRSADPGLQRILAKEFPGERVIPRPDGPSPELRGELSLCTCVVGSPAAVMAAWSCGVPGLCVGFSPRAVGLAEELFGRWEDAVVPIASLRQEEDLALAFRCFLSVMDDQRKLLESAVPRRREQAQGWEDKL